MSKSPCFPFYPSDFFGDIKVRVMTGEEQAFYLLLLANIWEYDTQFSIPDDPKIIATLLKISEEKFQEIFGKILVCFEQKNGRLLSKRLKKEKCKQDNYRKLQSEKGKKGGRPAKAGALPGLNPGLTEGKAGEKPEESSSKPKPKPISKPKKIICALPTFEQVREYCLERKNSVDAQKWFDHYTSNGWMVGKNKMKDWKAAVRTWERSEFGGNGNGKKAPPPLQDKKLSPYRVCDRCGNEYLETDVIEVGGAMRCPKCPDVREESDRLARVGIKSIYDEIAARGRADLSPPTSE